MMIGRTEFDFKNPDGGASDQAQIERAREGGRVRRLRKIELEITSECIVGRRSAGKGCVHCSLKAGTGRASYLSVEEIRGVLRDACVLGASIVVLTGGEPAQHPHFMDALEYAKQQGLETRVYTTGVPDAWTSCRLEDAAELIDKVYLSVEGLGVPHDDVLRWPGASEHTKGFIRELKRLGIRWAAHFTPMKTNYSDLESVARFVYAFGADSMKLIDFVPQGRGWDNRATLELDDQEYFELFSTVRKLQQDLRRPQGSPFVSFHDETYTSGRSAKSPFGSVIDGGCTSGRDTCAILSDGMVIPCLGFRLELSGDSPRQVHLAGNIRTQSFREIWEGSDVLLRFSDSRAEDVNPSCGGCSMKDLCLGCCSCRRTELERIFDQDRDPQVGAAPL